MALTFSQPGAYASWWAINSYVLSHIMAHRHVFLLRGDPDMPSAEVVASALLQLKNNPRLFEKWKHRQGHTFQGEWADVWRHISAN
jgi:hypothetical protein